MQAEPRSSVTLRYEQVLPEVCVRCGEPASVHVEYLFFEPATERDEAAVNLGNAAINMFLMVVTAMGAGGHTGPDLEAKGKQHLVRLPFCADHAALRTRIEMRQMWAVIAVLIAILTPLLAMIVPLVMWLAPADNAPKEPRPLAILGLASGWVVSVGTAVYLWRIRNRDTEWIVPTEVGEERMTLDGVSPRFALEAKE